MPQSLSAWMVVLDKTLGSRMTLYKAPRGSERELKDANAFCKNDFWSLVVCQPSQPLLPTEYVTPESGTFFSHEQGRSLTEPVWQLVLFLIFYLKNPVLLEVVSYTLIICQDKQETAQWLASPSTIRAILEACLSRVSSLKGQTCIIHHKTMYEGNLEKVGGVKTDG